MKAAVINLITLFVDNVIVADPAVDEAPEGTMLVSIPDDSTVSIGWTYDGNGFVAPSVNSNS